MTRATVRWNDAIAVVYLQGSMKKPVRRRRLPWLVAHRGAMDEAPENTQSAFDRALTYAIDGIELDVQMTKDGELVVYHDEDLARISGTKQAIADVNHDDLRRLDWGGWFAEPFRGEALPTLQETLDRLATRTRLLIEIKSFEKDRRTGRSLDIAARVLELLDERIRREHDENIFILSFDPQLLLHASMTTPRWRYVLNTENPSAALADPDELRERLYACCASVSRLERPIVDAWHKAGHAAMTYSCNTPGDVDRAIQIGCDVAMTDRPGWMVRYLGGQISTRAKSTDR